MEWWLIVPIITCRQNTPGQVRLSSSSTWRSPPGTRGWRYWPDWRWWWGGCGDGWTTCCRLEPHLTTEKVKMREWESDGQSMFLHDRLGRMSAKYFSKKYFNLSFPDLYFKYYDHFSTSQLYRVGNIINMKSPIFAKILLFWLAWVCQCDYETFGVTKL